jgi:hypothetical protein
LPFPNRRSSAAPPRFMPRHLDRGSNRTFLPLPMSGGLKLFYFAIFAFALGSVTNTAAIAQSCTLKQQVIGTPGCFEFVGYSGGQRVGFLNGTACWSQLAKGVHPNILTGLWFHPIRSASGATRLCSRRIAAVHSEPHRANESTLPRDQFGTTMWSGARPALWRSTIAA